VIEAEKIKQDLISNFNLPDETVRIQRPKRLWLETGIGKFAEIFDYAVKQAGFTFLCAITGLDEGADFGLIYHLSREDGVMLNLKTKTPKERSIKTITDYFPSGAIYERELNDLLGIEVTGLPEGRRYPLPDDWPAGEYPLRKGWNTERLDKEKGAKNG
jgi:Ni,Fe-hydrogenase III component G